MTNDDRLRLAGALGLPWLFIWQGLDFTDQGYVLTGYRSFFRHPEVTADSGGLWLTNLIGASWDAAFGSLGVVGMRALWALCMSVGLLLAFRLARQLTNPSAAALGVFAASLFLSNRRETWFSYNTSTSLLFAAATLCLVEGIARQSRRRLFAGGALLGVLPFARFPNILGLVLPVGLALAAWLDQERRPRLARDVGATLLGIVCGAGGVIALIHVRGDATLVATSIQDLFAPSWQAAGYAPSALLDKFVSDQSNALGLGLGVCLAAAVLARLLAKLPGSVAWAVAVACGALAAFALSTNKDSWRFVVSGVAYWALGAVAFGMWRRSLALRVACGVSLLVLIVAPLGSNNGIRGAHMGMWLALPLLLAVLYALEDQWLNGQGRRLALVVCLAVAGEGLYQTTTYTYRDAARSRLRAPVAHAQLRWQYTTKERAKVVEEVLSALEQRVKPGDYLLAYEGTPLLQYLTRTRPYLNRPWLMGAENGAVVAELAAQAPQRTGCLPVAVQSLKTTRSMAWPRAARSLEQKEPQRGTRKAIKAFLRQHDYHQTWRNEFFSIWEPPAEKRTGCR